MLGIKIMSEDLLTTADAYHGASLGAQAVKESACNVGDPGSSLGLGRSLGEGNGNPLQYSGLGNSMNRGALQATVHRVAKSQIPLRDEHFHFFSKLITHLHDFRYC